MSGAEWQLVGFSLRMALANLLLILPVGLALAWWLARKDWRGKAVVETLVSLPLVLPPVVVGYLLLACVGSFSPGLTLDSLAVLLGALAIALQLSWHFGKRKEQ